MTTTAMLMQEIETLPEEFVAEALNFVVFLKNKSFEISSTILKRISIEDAHGIFKDLKGMDTTIERDEDRV
jgi:hypothetical protein